MSAALRAWSFVGSAPTIRIVAVARPRSRPGLRVLEPWPALRQRHHEAHEDLLVPELGDVPRGGDLRMLSISLSSEQASYTTMTLAIESSVLLQGSPAPRAMGSGRVPATPIMRRNLP